MKRISTYKDRNNLSDGYSVPVLTGPPHLRLTAGEFVQIRPDYFLIQAGRLGDGRMDPTGDSFPVNDSGNVRSRYPERAGDRRLIQVHLVKSVLNLQGGHAAFLGFCIHGFLLLFYCPVCSG